MRVKSFLICLSLLTALHAVPSYAAVLSADFALLADLPDISLGPREFQSLGTTLGAGNELDSSDEVSNPSGWSGSAFIDLSATGLITLTGDQPLGFADYDLAIFTISGMDFSAGEGIVGVTSLLDGLLDPGFGLGQISPFVSFTSNSVKFVFDTTALGQAADFQFLHGGVSTFQLQLAPVPLPASLPLLAFGVGGLAAVRRRKTNA